MNQRIQQAFQQRQAEKRTETYKKIAEILEELKKTNQQLSWLQQDVDLIMRSLNIRRRK